MAGANPDGVVAAVLAFIFETGLRPDLDAISELAVREGNPVAFQASHVPDDPAENWVELLASGFAFDCRGLAPGPAETAPGDGAFLGLHERPDGECVTIAPSPHLAEGCGVLPIMRVLTGIGAQLGQLPGVQAIFWYPSRCWMAPRYFCGVIQEWLAGGPFPALGLTSLQRDPGGGMVSAGLDFLIQQELRFEPDRRLVAARAAKIAMRLINDLVLRGPLKQMAEFVGPEGERLILQPVENNRRLKVTML